jgi:hypothetical protein
MISFGLGQLMVIAVVVGGRCDAAARNAKRAGRSLSSTENETSCPNQLSHSHNAIPFRLLDSARSTRPELISHSTDSICRSVPTRQIMHSLRCWRIAIRPSRRCRSACLNLARRSFEPASESAAPAKIRAGILRPAAGARQITPGKIYAPPAGPNKYKTACSRAARPTRQWANQ